MNHNQWRARRSTGPAVSTVLPDRQHWIHPKYNFFLPVKVLGRVFRGKFMERLQRAHQRKELDLSGVSAPLSWASGFQSLVNRLFAQDWVAYAKRAFGGPASVLRYLGRYTHRVAISNHRLVAFDGERVTFRWKDYAHGNKQKLMTLPATEFLRRYVQHVLPRGFVRIRQYGYLASHCRTASLALARTLLGVTLPPQPPIAAGDHADSDPPWHCPACGGPMKLGLNLTARQLARQCSFFDSS